MGRLVKRRSRINTKRGERRGTAAFTGKVFRAKDGAKIIVLDRIGGHNRTIYSAKCDIEYITITAKALRKLVSAARG